VNSAIDANSSLFGLEERTASGGLRLQRAGRPLAMWNHDTLSANADTNLYGSHPFVLEVRPGTVSMSCSLRHHEFNALPCVVFSAACTVVCTHFCFFFNHLVRRQHLQCMQDHIWHACILIVPVRQVTLTTAKLVLHSVYELQQPATICMYRVITSRVLQMVAAMAYLCSTAMPWRRF